MNNKRKIGILLIIIGLSLIITGLIFAFMINPERTPYFFLSSIIINTVGVSLLKRKKGDN